MSKNHDYFIFDGDIAKQNGLYSAIIYIVDGATHRRKPQYNITMALIDIIDAQDTLRRLPRPERFTEELSHFDRAADAIGLEEISDERSHREIWASNGVRSYIGRYGKLTIC